jgi:7-cyano-7-deazaguanine reductase
MSEHEDRRNLFRTDGTLDTFPNEHRDRDYQIEFVAPEFTSVCPMTGLPDFGTITVRYTPDELCIELRSFKYYLFSFRNEGIFYEQLVNRIRDDIIAAILPRRLEVVGDFNARGGITARVTAAYNGSDRRDGGA